MQDFRKHIAINPIIQFGKPCIKETRITVLEYLSQGMLWEEHIKACLLFAAEREQKIRIV